MSHPAEADERIVFLQRVPPVGTDQEVIVAMSPHDVAPRLLSASPEADRYYIIASDINCQLIVAVYDELTSREMPAKIFAGSRLLSWPLDVQSPLASGLWHAVTAKTRECYRFRAQFAAASAGGHLFSPEPFCLPMLVPLLRFAGFDSCCFDLPFLASVLCEIGDPRWFFQPWRFRDRDPIKQLARYFGLFLTSRSISELAKRRQSLLVGLWSQLPEHAWLRQEYVARRRLQPATRAASLLGPKILLEFICRNWLSILTEQNYFDPTRFFRCEDALRSYDQQRLHPLRKREA